LSAVEVSAAVDFAEIAGRTGEANPWHSLLTFSDRVSRIGDVAVIAQVTPAQVPYADATELLTAPLIGVVPRSLWPGKPVLSAGYEMTSIYYGLPTSGYSSSAVTPYGDLWRHGGPFVLVLGMMFLGWLLRMVDGLGGVLRTDPRGLFLPALLLASIAKQENDYVSLMAGLPATLLVAYSASRLVRALSRTNPGCGRVDSLGAASDGPE
jgi:hypothetical protein